MNPINECGFLVIQKINTEIDIANRETDLIINENEIHLIFFLNKSMLIHGNLATNGFS